MPLDLTKIVEKWDNGTSDMGSLTFGRTISGSVDDNDKARFWLPDTRYLLIAIRGHFEFGSGVADFAIHIDSGPGEAYDTKLMTIENAGVGINSEDVHFRIFEADERHWLFDGRRNDTIVCTWTNPVPGTMRWGLQVFLYPIAEQLI